MLVADTMAGKFERVRVGIAGILGGTTVDTGTLLLLPPLSTFDLFFGGRGGPESKHGVPKKPLSHNCAPIHDKTLPVSQLDVRNHHVTYDITCFRLAGSTATAARSWVNDAAKFAQGIMCPKMLVCPNFPHNIRGNHDSQRNHFEPGWRRCAVSVLRSIISRRTTGVGDYVSGHSVRGGRWCGEGKLHERRRCTSRGVRVHAALPQGCM